MAVVKVETPTGEGVLLESFFAKDHPTFKDGRKLHSVQYTEESRKVVRDEPIENVRILEIDGVPVKGGLIA